MPYRLPFFINQTPATTQPGQPLRVRLMMGTAHHNQTAGSALGVGVGDANDAVPGAGGGGYSDPDGGPTSGVQPPPQVCWERFIQKKTIKVLLVESDDSTRQVVSALLRHCMYEGLSLLSSFYLLTSVYLFICLPFSQHIFLLLLTI